MTQTPVSGQTLLDNIRINLGGLSNAFTDDQLIYFCNLGVQETWSVLRSLDYDYFGVPSQDAASGSAQDDYFADLSVSKREYDLPKNCREIRGIEVLSSGFEDRVFTYRKFEDPVFQNARRSSSISGPGNSGCGEYFYTVFGNQMILSQFPEAALAVRLWYVASIDDVTIDQFPPILHPFSSKITDYATERAVKSSQNIELDQDWILTWKDSVKTLALTAGPRTSTGPTFISEFCDSSSNYGFGY